MSELNNPFWSNGEIKTFLSLLAEDRIQAELDRTVRGERAFQQLSAAMENHGYPRTSKQCRDKLEKLKDDYWAVKDHNGQSGADQKTSKWFAEMDAIYGERPVSNGRLYAVEYGIPASAPARPKNETIATEQSLLQTLEMSDIEDASDLVEPSCSLMPPSRSSTPLSQQSSCSGYEQCRKATGKRKRSTVDIVSVLEEMMVADERRSAAALANEERLIKEMRQHREEDVAMRRRELAQADAFLELLRDFLGTVAKKRQ